MRKLLVLVFVMMLVSCGEQPSNIQPTIDRVDQDIRVRVLFYDNADQLEEAYRQVNNLSNRQPVPEPWGFAQWNEWRDANGNYVEPEGVEYFCTIHTFRPRRQNDHHTTTLGHELLHCLYGSYHP